MFFEREPVFAPTNVLWQQEKKSPKRLFFLPEIKLDALLNKLRRWCNQVHVFVR